MRQIGNYTVEETPLGSGGMGRVLKGYGPNNVPVAIKEILPQYVADYEIRSRLQSEVEFLKKLNHRNVVKIYDAFQLGANMYIVMEYAEGMNIDQAVQQRGAIPAQEAMGYMVKILETMQYVHERGIVHRDIKPGNIMLKPNGDICILDFGVAKDVGGGAGRGKTVVGTVIGTDGYMSPEQADGMTIDQRADIYALGCVFFFMLTGHHAFERKASEVELQLDIMHKPFPRLKEYVKGLPGYLQGILDSAVDKNMLRRYQTCHEFKNALLPYLPSTQVDRGRTPVTVTVGRENCDIIVGQENYKVSRHHADITFKEFTGGCYYVYTDCSSNGTVINGQHYERGMSYNIIPDDNPEILLAGDYACRLDLDDMKAMVKSRMRELVPEDHGRNPGASGQSRTGGLRGEAAPGGPRPGARLRHSQARSMTLPEAVKTCFRKYACFRGRAARPEFWWFYLFTQALTLIAYFITLPFILEGKLWLCAIPGAFVLAFLLPSLAVASRRFHDVGLAFWVYALLLVGTLVPLLGIVCAVFMLIYLCREGVPVANRYGQPVSGPGFEQ